MFNLYFYVPLVFIIVSSIMVFYGIKRGANKKTAFFSQIISMIILSLACFICAASKVCVKAQTAETIQAADQVAREAQASSRGLSYGLGLIAAAVAVGIAGLGGGIAVAYAAPAAIAALTEDSTLLGKLIIFTILGEAISIYGFVISMMILNKLDALLFL
ncbi:MAG: V-type ATP synthase subunit C [Candidatus Improbicoccus devescovinae]|nr:MAG: V-type ATP synthase subunit C [Candidatus Improbicoccus devescovinae]